MFEFIIMFSNQFNKKHELVEDIIDNLLRSIIYNFYCSFQEYIKKKETLFEFKLKNLYIDEIVNKNKNQLFQIYKQIKKYYEDDEEDNEEEEEKQFIIFLQNFKKEDITLMKNFNNVFKINEKSNLNTKNELIYNKYMELTKKYNELRIKFNELIQEHNNLVDDLKRKMFYIDYNYKYL